MNTDRLRIAVFDYEAGNLHSLVKSLETDFTTVRVDRDPAAAVRDTDALVLPGVGAFTPAAQRLASGRDAMRAALLDGLPCLGICLGMQLLFDHSDEGPGDGLGVLTGRVTRLEALRVPQIGWNMLEPTDPLDPLLSASGLETVYYANSFVCRPTGVSAQHVIAYTTHETDRFPAAVRVGNVVGAQFHPEKSSAAGVRFVRAFLHEAQDRAGQRGTLGSSATKDVTS
jgi:imidazole glycerol-phosphate synthase subunit HisH